MLKQRVFGDDNQKLLDLYILGLNTLQALMYLTRLQREWEEVTSK
jgi:hypothetical protein